MAIGLVESPHQVLEKESQIKELENAKSDSRLLALDNEYMQVSFKTVYIRKHFVCDYSQLEDQFGNPIKIPPNEKKALVVAMTLHEKGRTALKKTDYHKALVFFLEADQEFKYATYFLE